MVPAATCTPVAAPATFVVGAAPPPSSDGADGWPRLLGAFETHGTCMTRLRAGEVSAGEELTLKRAAPVATVGTKAAGRGAGGRGGGRAGGAGGGGK